MTNYSQLGVLASWRENPSADGHAKPRRKKVMMSIEGINIATTGMSSNPADLHVYRKKQQTGNTTPAGVAQPIFINYIYKHLMPLASGSRKEAGMRY